MMARRSRHNVFVSYYRDQDQQDKERFIRMLGDSIIDRSVNIGDIPGPNPPTEATLQQIREEFIAQVSVTVVLIGRCTWQRKFVDWEIGASLRDTEANPRCGLLGILLPGHPDLGHPIADNLFHRDWRTTATEMTRLHRSTTGQVIQMSYEAGFTTHS